MNEFSWAGFGVPENWTVDITKATRYYTSLRESIVRSRVEFSAIMSYLNDVFKTMTNIIVEVTAN